MFKININPDSIQRSQSGMLTAEIYVSTDDFFFPEEKWNDSAVIVLNWWFEKVNVLLNSSLEEIFKFMDGPLFFKGEIFNSRFYFKFFLNNQLIEKADVDQVIFVKELLAASKILLNKCNLEKWLDDDILKLNRNVNLFDSTTSFS